MIINKVMVLPLGILDDSNKRTQINDVLSSKGLISNTFFRNTSTITLIISSLVSLMTMLAYNPLFTTLFLIISMPCALARVYFDKKYNNLSLEKSAEIRKSGYYRWLLTDLIPAKDIRMFNLSEDLKSRYEYERDKYVKEKIRIDNKKTLTLVFMSIIELLGLLLFFVFVISETFKSNITIGQCTLYISLSILIEKSFGCVFYNIFIDYSLVYMLMKRVEEFMNIKDKENDKGTDIEEINTIEFRGVTFRYPNSNNNVITNVSFCVKKGEKITIIGRNGSGKTTLIKLLLGFYSPTKGTILVNGVSLCDYNIKKVRSLIVVLFQDYARFAFSIRKNVDLSDNANTNDDLIINALSRAHLYDDIKDKLIDGLDTNLTKQFDEKGIELSQGQWQKLALSRIYANRSSLVILDEPSSSLDPLTEDAIFKDFLTNEEFETGIMITHRIAATSKSTRIILLSEGKILESGTHAQLMSLNGNYAQMFRLQSEKY